MAQGDLTVAAISAEEHLAFVEAQRSASFLQTPAWGAVKSEWRARVDRLARRRRARSSAPALVLHRPVPKLKRYTLAYLPEGPLIDWADADLGRWLDPMAAYLKKAGAFGIRMGAPGRHPPLDRRAGQGGPGRPGRPHPARRRDRARPGGAGGSPST